MSNLFSIMFIPFGLIAMIVLAVIGLAIGIVLYTMKRMIEVVSDHNRKYDL